MIYISYFKCSNDFSLITAQIELYQYSYPSIRAVNKKHYNGREGMLRMEKNRDLLKATLAEVRFELENSQLMKLIFRLLK